MRKTVFVVEERYSSATRQEARATLQQRVTLWLVGALRKHRD